MIRLRRSIAGRSSPKTWWNCWASARSGFWWSEFACERGGEARRYWCGRRSTLRRRSDGKRRRRHSACLARARSRVEQALRLDLPFVAVGNRRERFRGAMVCGRRRITSDGLVLHRPLGVHRAHPRRRPLDKIHPRCLAADLGALPRAHHRASVMSFASTIEEANGAPVFNAVASVAVGEGMELWIAASEKQGVGCKLELRVFHAIEESAEADEYLARFSESVNA